MENLRAELISALWDLLNAQSELWGDDAECVEITRARIDELTAGEIANSRKGSLADNVIFFPAKDE